ncbi:YhcG family protein [Dyadobacter sp. CY343]|uniref:PDDEXK nuclease domain-containing protein n=1 Tax=Dyadobacter sp. CY343 TaxID=2907299 RepID=UPI001F15ADC5|nr:PDDEXK nuclease domain-containing protein [Dyadobacter sp. CY343]MCE7061947.1 PDDEXK nuclease domain-containing protein [Dyadobacter sp. CY343]
MTDYIALLEQLKKEIREARLRATISANVEMLSLYWKIGKIILDQEQQAGWGQKVVLRLVTDLKAEFPNMKSLSPRNLRYMKSFAAAYPDESILQVTLAKLTWYHHITLLSKVKDPDERLFYITETAQQGWSRDVMIMQIESNYSERHGNTVSNFARALPDPLSDLAQQSIKDPYLFDFLTLADGYKERDLENGLVEHITKFLLELGKGFAFVGRQYPIEVSDREFSIDLLFYHLKLRAYLVIELKAVEFEPEFVGKLNFYLSAVDDQLRTEHDNPTIGLLICRKRDKLMAEYALRDVNKPIGISEYRISEALPDELKSTLPTIEEIEERLEQGENKDSRR